MEAAFEYRFFPVGQGLFASGMLRYNASDRFVWVYDCGSISKGSNPDDAITEFNAWHNEDNKINLLTLSHFDYDHINGVCDLLRQRHVNFLMLPYMALADRLVIAFEEGLGGSGDPMSAFFIDPVAYLLSQSDGNIDVILFVPPSGDEGPPFGADNINFPLDPNMDWIERLGKPEQTDTPDDRDTLRDSGSKHGSCVAFLSPGATLLDQTRLWEFIPYNDDLDIDLDRKFIADVARYREALLAEGNTKRREDALERLRDLYDEQFKSIPKQRNRISLHLYSGPVYSSLYETKLFYPALIYDGCIEAKDLILLDTSIRHLTDVQSTQCSILYTGDGFVDRARKLNRLIKYLDPSRVSQTGTFQVMHHGSRHNWYEGVAEAIAPVFSIFSSDPNRGSSPHPHKEVLYDFWQYGPIQVDFKNSFVICGIISDKSKASYDDVGFKKKKRQVTRFYDDEPPDIEV